MKIIVAKKIHKSIWIYTWLSYKASIKENENYVSIKVTYVKRINRHSLSFAIKYDFIDRKIVVLAKYRNQNLHTI